MEPVLESVRLYLPVIAVIYCMTRAASDIKQKKYVWAVFGAISAFIILAVPVPVVSQVVSIDLPAP